MLFNNSPEAAVPDRVLGAIRVNGIYCPVTNLFDDMGEETRDFALAVVFVAQLPDGQWISAGADEANLIRMH